MFDSSLSILLLTNCLVFSLNPQKLKIINSLKTKEENSTSVYPIGLITSSSFVFVLFSIANTIHRKKGLITSAINKNIGEK